MLMTADFAKVIALNYMPKEKVSLSLDTIDKYSMPVLLTF